MLASMLVLPQSALSVSAGAQTAVSQPGKDTDSEPSGNRGTFKFDPGDWGSESIMFIIVDETEDPVKFATKDGWVTEYPEDTSVIEGTKLPDGTFESFEFEIPDERIIYLEVLDPFDITHDTFDCNLTKDAFGDTATLTGTSVVSVIDRNTKMPEIEFKNSGLKSRLYFDYDGNIIGSQINPYNTDGAGQVAIFVYGFSRHTDENGNCVVTPEKVAAAIEAFGTNADDVFKAYKEFEGYDDRYNEDFARSVIYPDDKHDDKPDDKPETFTYYFLAPDDWCNTEKGALNSDIGFYCWKWLGVNEESKFEANAEKYPGVKMTPAPEIGENVFKIEGVDPGFEECMISDFSENHSLVDANLYHTENVLLDGYGNGNEECLYDSSLVTDNFNGWIFVLNLDEEVTTAVIPPRKGQWFTLDDYKKHDDYYGTYFRQKDPDDKPDNITGCYGDIDTDGQITANDALAILRSSVGMELLVDVQMIAADVDSDGQVTANDALAVLRVSVGFPNEGKIGEKF